VTSLALEENKALVRGFIESYNNRKLDQIDRFIAADYVDHSNGVDREGLKQLFAMGLGAFPDWHETVEDIIAEKDKVWVRLTYTGTHKAEFMGLPATATNTNPSVDSTV
jgi:predicted ester cyclase